MLTLLESTATEPLLDYFCRSIQSAPGGVFADHRLIIPSMTTGDWLLNQTADRLGICARLTPGFLAELVWHLAEKITGDTEPGGHAPLSAAAMQWQLFADFCQDSDAPPDDPVQLLLRAVPPGPDDKFKSYRLIAERLAAIYIRYLNMRPDWLWRWSTGEPPALAELLSDRERLHHLPEWMQKHSETIAKAQCMLWQKHFAPAYLRRCLRLEMFWRILQTRCPLPSYPYYSRRLDDPTIAALCQNHPPLATYFHRLQQQAAQQGEILPDKIWVYGIESISKEQWDFLCDLGRFCDIEVYHHCISHEYFADMYDEKWLQRLQAGGKDEGYHSTHPLFSGLAKQQRSTFRLLEAGEQFAQTHALPFFTRQTLSAEPPPTDTLLHLLQRELYALDSGYLSANPAAATDDSLRIHACHGLLRQLEVLRAEIARCLNQDPELQLSDILIVLPEVGKHRAIIQAVFPPGGQYDGFYLPARITGITPPTAQNLWQALAGGYRLGTGYFDSEKVTDWLLNDEVCSMLGTEHEAMTRICRALISAGFRRGFDENDLPAADDDSRFSFCYALDRLCAGLLLPDIDCYADGTVPAPGLHLEDAAAINALCRLANRYRNLKPDARFPVRHWLGMLRESLAEDFAHAADSAAYHTVEKTLADTDARLAALERDSAIKPPAVRLSFVLDDIDSRLAAQQSSSEPSGVITIGRLGAMRGLPYKLIALVNFNLDDFPGNRRDDRYDLIYLDRPRYGDRKSEHEDLGALPEIIANAGHRLLIFYNRYRDDGEEQLPAAPVQELLHYLNSQTGYHAENSPFHILQQSDPFRPGQNPHHTTAPLWHKVAAVLAQNHPRPAPYLTAQIPETLPPPPESQEAITLSFSALSYALENPAAHYAKSRAIAIPGEHPPPEYLEPLTLSPLAGYQLNQHLIEQLRQPGFDPLPYLPLLPVAAAGKIALQQAQQDIQQRLEKLLAYSGSDRLSPLKEQVLSVAGLHLSIALPESAVAPWLQLHPGKSKAKHLLRLWLAHLLRHMAGQHGESLCAFQDQLICLHPPAAGKAEALLLPWLALWYYSGKHLWPLPPELGYELSNGHPAAKRIDDWLQRIKDPQYKNDRLWHLFLRDQPDPAALIAACAQRYGETLYLPLQQHLEAVG